MKVAILGANGQDGRLLLKCITEEYSIDAIAIARRFDKAYFSNLKSERLSYIELDLLDSIKLKNTLLKARPNYIFYCAAVHGASGFNYESRFEEVVAVNISGLKKCLEYSITNDCKIIYFSSAKVFKKLEGVINEVSEKKGNCIYSMSKLLAKDLLEYYKAKYSTDYLNIYFFNHESEFRSEKYFSYKLARCLQRARMGDSFKETFESLEFWCDWGSAEEYMKLLLKLSFKQSTGDFIFSTGSTTYAKDLVDNVFSKYDLEYLDFMQFTQPDKIVRDMNIPFVADNSKLVSTLGLAPNQDIHDLIDYMSNRI